MIVAYLASEKHAELAGVYPNYDAFFKHLDRLVYEAGTMERVVSIAVDNTELDQLINHYDVGPDQARPV